jgi:hypothetical protein
MWDERQRQRFKELRQRDLPGLLSQAEEAELASLGRELEQAEAAYLAPATRRLHREREAIETQNRNLQTLVRRKEAFVRRLRDFLTDAHAERNAIEGELSAVLGGGAENSAKDR